MYVAQTLRLIMHKLSGKKYIFAKYLGYVFDLCVAAVEIVPYYIIV